MRLSPSEIGDRTEAAVLRALADAGKFILIPFSASQRYDLVFEDETGFHRVQCKTVRQVGDVITFRTCSYTNKVLKHYRGEIDYFGVCCPTRDEVYLVPVDHVASRGAYLRLTPTKNGQAKGVRWARDYLLTGPGGRTVVDATAATDIPASDARTTSFEQPRLPL